MTTTEMNPDRSLMKAPALARAEKRGGIRRKVRERVLAAPAATRAEADPRFPGAAPLKPLAVSVLQARALLSIGNSMIWKLISAGKLERVKLGAKSLVTYSSIERFVDELRRGPK